MLSPLQQADNLVKQGQFMQAETIYQQLLTMQSAQGEAYLGLGNIALAKYQADKAIRLLTQACHLLPQAPAPLLQLANAFNAVCSEPDALTVLNYAQQTFPQSAAVFYQLAQQHLMSGEFALAEQNLRGVIDLNQGAISSHALFELVRCKRHTPQDIATLQQRLNSQSTEHNEQTLIHYALGNACHITQEHQTAWMHFCQANRLQSQHCDFATAQLKDFYAQIKQVASQNLLAIKRPVVSDEITPIFIVGLPRSGSTLLEQMLARHPLIAAGGELPYLSREVDNYLCAQSGNHYPHSMQNLSAECLEEAAQIYLTALSRHARNKPYVIDKLPANFQSIALIYKLFPNAKVIHLQRHPAAVAFSVFRNYFAQHEPYFCSLDEFRQYHHFYLDLMAHWHKVIVDFVFDVSYEELVKQPKHSMQSILAFCGIDWDNACLSNSQVQSPITTLSNIDARQPVMKSIKQEWLPYQAHLQAFLPEAPDLRGAQQHG